ncbi:MAG TPA: hypothetical protein VK540_00095 [Polyangiaceae bacterium]|nr:hypothetical protein [Polyangiaceae bacterium]
MKAENRLSVTTPFLAAQSLSLPRKVGPLLLPLLLGLAACAGGAASTPPPETPAENPATATAAATPPPEKPAATEAPTSSPPPSLASAATPTSAPPKIDFPPHATVDQAIKAIPQGTARTNMADDALRAPLLDLKRYDQCKVPRSTKVTMTVAIYDGAAVGADISSKPKNAKIEECVDGVVRGMTWSKVPSLNTVNVSF